MSNAEIDRMIAEKVMGLKSQREEIYYGGPSKWHDDPKGGWYLHSDGYRTPAEGFTPTTDLNHAAMAFKALSIGDQQKVSEVVFSWPCGRRDGLIFALEPLLLSKAIAAVCVAVPGEESQR